MPTTIVTKFGVSPGIPPAEGELAIGELAVNHADKKIYTKTVAEGVVELIGGGGGDPGELPVGTDGDLLYNNGGTWEVSTPFLELQANPDKPGQRELALKDQLQFTQYDSNGDPAVELIGDTLAGEAGIRVMKSGTGAGSYGLELECAANNSSRLAMRRSGTSTAEDIVLLTGAAAADATITCSGPVISTGGTSEFAGIKMEGTNAGINMQDLHRVFNHPDPSTAESTNVANARWVNNNYVSRSTSQTVGGTKTWTGEQYHSTNIRVTNGSVVMSNGSVQLISTSGTNTAQRKDYIDAGDSDIRLKKNLRPLDGSLDKLMGLETFLYDWDGEGKAGVLRKRDWHKTRYGLSAQNVQSIFPDAVHHLASDRDEAGNSVSGQNYLGMMYEELVPVLVQAIQELNAKVEALTS